MLPGSWIDTIEVVLTGGPQLVPIPDGTILDLVVGVNAFPWGFAGASAGPFFPVAANAAQPIPYDTKMELWVQGAGTVHLALYGQAGSIGGSVVPPSTDVLLQEDGFALLQEDGSFILLEP